MLFVFIHFHKSKTLIESMSILREFPWIVFERSLLLMQLAAQLPKAGSDVGRPALDEKLFPWIWWGCALCSAFVRWVLVLFNYPSS